MNYHLAGFDTLGQARQFGLPLHLYDGRKIARNLHAFQSLFQDAGINGRVCYAVKACGFPEIIKIAARAGAGADVASEFELATALEAGIPPGKLVIHGNAKSDAYLEQSVALGVLIAANHYTELDRIEAEAKKQCKQARVILRLSGFDLGPVTATGIFTAGVWCKFGEPVDRVPELLAALGKWPHIDLIGFHVHIGSQITEVEPYRAVFGVMAELAMAYREVVGRPVQVIDLGGGFPVSYVDRRTWGDLQKVIRRQAVGFHPHPDPLPPQAGSRGRENNGKGTPVAVLNRNGYATWEGMTGGFRSDPETGRIDWSRWSGEKFYCPHEKEKMLARLFTGRIHFGGRLVSFKQVWERIGRPRLIVEPGRAIVGDAGITLARVVDVYNVAGVLPLVTLDLGLVNHGTGLVEPDLYSWTLANDPERKDRRPFRAFVAGRLCFSGDLLSRYRVAFPRKPVPGDIAVIKKTGAYAPNFFASQANGFPLPVQVLVAAGGKTMRLND
jgi:diaminopimelate decarboxylase